MLGKRKVRKYVFELLCGYECNTDIDALEYFNISFDNFLCEDDENDTVRTIFTGVLRNLEKIDGIITSHANNWQITRLSTVTRSILRLSVYEMLELKLPPAISINEAVEISKLYAEDKAPSFINGILNAISKDLNKDE